jgi:hypothetical protein
VASFDLAAGIWMGGFYVTHTHTHSRLRRVVNVFIIFRPTVMAVCDTLTLHDLRVIDVDGQRILVLEIRKFGKTFHICN